MAYKLRVKFDGKCPKHPKYDPSDTDTITSVKGFECAGCEDLFVIHLYGKIIGRRIANSTVLKAETTGVIIPAHVDPQGMLQPQFVVMEKDIPKPPAPVKEPVLLVKKKEEKRGSK